MNPEQNPEPTNQLPTAVQPKQNDPNQKPRWTIGKNLFGSALGIINLLVLGFAGINLFFLVMLYLHPSPVSILAIGIEPLIGISLVIISVIDGIYCFKYLLRENKSTGKRVAATAGLIISVVILGFVVYVVYLNISGIYQLTHRNYDQQATATSAQYTMTTASKAGYGFDILAPNFIPFGYSWHHGEINEDTYAGADAIYSYISYTKWGWGQDYGFAIIVYSKRASFHPPTGCGYFQEPINTDPYRAGWTYPCQLIGKTASGNPVYHYEGPDTDCRCKAGDSISEAYYMAYGRNLGIVTFPKDHGELSVEDVLKIMNSLTIIPIETIVKNNIASE